MADGERLVPKNEDGEGDGERPEGDGVEAEENAPGGDRKFGPRPVSDQINGILAIAAMATAFVAFFLYILCRLVFCANDLVWAFAFLSFGCSIASYTIYRLKPVCNLAIFVLSILALVFGVVTLIWSLFLMATCDTALVNAPPKTTAATAAAAAARMRMSQRRR